MKKLEKLLKSIDGGKVIDLASGNGGFINYIKEFNSFEKIVAVDKIEGALNQIPQIFPDLTIETITADIENLDFADKSYDTVCLSNSIHHLPHPEKIFDEMKRILHDNGQIILHEMCSDNLTANKSRALSGKPPR